MGSAADVQMDLICCGGDRGILLGPPHRHPSCNDPVLHTRRCIRRSFVAFCSRTRVRSADGSRQCRRDDRLHLQHTASGGRASGLPRWRAGALRVGLLRGTQASLTPVRRSPAKSHPDCVRRRVRPPPRPRGELATAPRADPGSTAPRPRGPRGRPGHTPRPTPRAGWGH